MDTKLECFLKEMRTMEYSEDVASKNPPPNGITAAEIEALSAKAYSNCEPLPVASEVLPPEGVTYWQTLVDPNTNLPYYWNSSTNEVSWTLPEGGVIALPVSAEKADAQEKALEETLESYPYSATIPAEFIKPVVTTATASGDNGTTLSVVQSSSKRPLEVNTPSPVQPSQKKVRLQMEELSSLDGQPVTPSSAAVPTGGDKSVPQVGVDSPLKVAGDVARKLPSPGPVQLAAVLEERMKVQVCNMVAMLSKKLQYLQSSTIPASSSQLETLAIQLQTRQADWKEGGVTDKYMLDKLKKMNEEVFIFESSLLPEDWSLSPDSGSAAAVGGRSLGSEGRATGEEGDLSVPKAVEGVSPQIVSSDSEEGINKSTVAVVECSESSGVTYSETLHAENLTEDEPADSPGPSGPPEVIGSSLQHSFLSSADVSVDPETGMPERDMDEMGVARVGWDRNERDWNEISDDESRDEVAEVGRDLRDCGVMDGSGAVEISSGSDREENGGVYGRVEADKMEYDRIVEDVSDRDEEGEDEVEAPSLPSDRETRMVAKAQECNKEESGEEDSEEEGIWVEPGKERSEGELLDDSDGSDEEDSVKSKGGDDGKFGPKEEKSGKKKRVPDNYEKSEGELDQDSEDEKSEGELEDDDKEEVWEERTDYRVEKDRHANRKQHYRSKHGGYDDSDYSDYSASRRDKREHYYYDSDYSDDYYTSSRRSRHHRRSHKGRDRSRERSRDRYRNDSDYSDEYYSSRRHDRDRYGDGCERDYYQRGSHYGGNNKSSRSGNKSYGSSNSRYQQSRYSYDSDHDREHSRHGRASSGKQRKRERDKDKKRRHDVRGASQHKDSDGEEKKPAATVLIGKVGKISTVRLLGKEKKSEETESTKPADAAVSSAPPNPGVVAAPTTLPPVQAHPPQMSATYYQHPSTGEVPYYASYGTAYQYPAVYSTAQTYSQPPPPPPQQEAEVPAQTQQQEEGWVWITNADGTPQYVKASDAAANSTSDKSNSEGASNKDITALKQQQKKWGEVNPAQWGGADPVQWASTHALPPSQPPLPPSDPHTEDSEKPRPPQPEEEAVAGEVPAGTSEEKMCSSMESIDQQGNGTPLVTEVTEGQEQVDVPTEGVDKEHISDLTTQTNIATPATDDSVVDTPEAEAEAEVPMPSTEGPAAALSDTDQKTEDIAECEMEIESNHGSPVAPDAGGSAPAEGEGNGQVDALEGKGVEDEILLESLSSTTELKEQTVGVGDDPTSQTAPVVLPSGDMPASSSVELATTQTSEAQGPPVATVEEPAGAPAVQQHSEPVASSNTEGSAIQAATIASSSATYYPSSVAPPTADAAGTYSYAASYAQPTAYNYAYAQNYNYAYMQQAAVASYGAYGMQPGAAYYQGMYPAPAYATYPQTYYAATSYSSVPPPVQPPMSTASAGTSSSTDSKNGAKEKSSKSMMEQWAAFKQGEGKS